MNRTFYKTLIAAMWLALPLTALRFWLVWDQLPARMATHFDANWHANGWMPRETAFWFAIGITAFMLVVFTAILLVMVSRRETPPALSAVFLAFCYFIVGFVFYGNSKVVSYNLGEGSANVGLPILLVPLAIVIFTAVYLKSKRGRPLPPSDVIAEEVHRSPLFAAIMAIPAIFLLLSLATSNAKAALPIVGFVSVLMLLAGVSAWDGFHYIITHHGLEIRTLGYRLRSIPVEQIVRYLPGTWAFWRGYGIRGFGSTRAYVWGNRGVWIDTPDVHIFLGHDDPEGLIRDLEMIKQPFH